MPPNDFDAFVTRLQTEKDDNKQFWERQKDEFVAALDELYARVEDYLANYVSNGSISVDYYDIELNEEDTGLYIVRKCIITIGQRSVVLIPIGTQLIGTKGRVDVSGGFGRSRLVLVDANLKTFRLNISVEVNGEPERPQISSAEPDPASVRWVWRIVSNPPAMRFLEFNRDNFLSLLMGVSNA